MKNDRLFALFYLLLERGRCSAPELARLLEVSVRTVYRDVETLAQAGVPILTIAGKGGGISLMDGYVFDRAVLTESEQEQLLFALESLPMIGQPSHLLRTKLGAIFRHADSGWIEVDFSRWGHQQADQVRFERLRQAVVEKHLLQIDYCGSDKAPTQRIVKPFRLIFKERGWYLQAYCMKAQDYRIFKISRIRTATLLDERYADDFSAVPSYESHVLAPCEPLLLHFDASVAFRVLDEFDDEQVAWQPDGSAVVTAPFPLDGWVQSYLLGFGTQVRVISPAHLRETLAEQAKKIAAHHRS